MSNITPMEIEEALPAIIKSAEGAGVVITDSRFAQSDDELVSLLMGENDDQTVNGWILAWNELPSQEDNGPCDLIVTYGIRLVYLYGYYNTELEAEISAAVFRQNIAKVNEALNHNRDLGLGNQVRHKCLTTTQPFDLLDYTHNGANRLSHIAVFSLEVEATNTY